MVFLIFLSLGTLTYYAGSRPLKEGFWLEFNNEICIYFCSVLMANFLNARMPTYLADRLGWLFIGVLGANITVNLFFTIKDSVYNIFISMYNQNMLRKILNYIK